jgi:hypothetical protein
MQTAVMHKMGVTDKHNVTITASPRIFILGERTKEESEHGQMFRRVFRAELPRKLKEFTAAYMTRGTREYKEFEAATSKKDRATLSALALLRRAQSMKSPASKDLADAASLLLDWRPPEWAVAAGRKEGAAWWYRSLLNDGMKNARLVMARAKGGFAPAILCGDLRTAGFVFAAYKGVGVCAACHELFAPDAERSGDYCSDACGQNFRQKRYRMKLKQKARAKKTSKRKGKR